MGGRCRGLAEKRLVPVQAGRHVAYSDDRPRTFHFRAGASIAAFIAALLAARSGVVPLLPVERASAPRSIRSDARATLLQFTARRSGVSPRVSRASRFAPRSSKAAATSRLPRRAAM